jgi:CBS domain-containing protein
MEFEKFIVLDTQLIDDAIEMIEMNNSRCVIVVNSNSKVVGILSEGDVLRSILKGISIKSPVKNIMVTNFKYLVSKNDDAIIALFKDGVTLIPILDSENCLSDIIIFTEFIKNKRLS